MYNGPMVLDNRVGLTGEAGGGGGTGESNRGKIGTAVVEQQLKNKLHLDYFELKAIEKKQERFLSSHNLSKSRT